MERYEIAFTGQLLPGAQPDVVRANLARLFRADAGRIALLFSGRRIVIKNQLDAQAAEKYRATLARAGALVEVCLMLPHIEEIELAPPPDGPPGEPAPGGSAAAAGTPLQVPPRDPCMAAFAAVQAPDFGLAPLGADLQGPRPALSAPPLDLSRLSLAPAGSDLQSPAAPADSAGSGAPSGPAPAGQGAQPPR